MRNRKNISLAGLSLFVCFCLLRGTEQLAERFGGIAWLYALAEILSFGVPILIAFQLIQRDNNHPSLRCRISFYSVSRHMINVSWKFGTTAAAFSIVVDLLLRHFSGQAVASTAVTPLIIPQNILLSARLVIQVLLAAVIEEIFLRGILLTLYENSAGTILSLLLSGLTYALLYGDVLHIIGAFVSGVIYAYLVHRFNSLFPAIIAHMTGNLYYLLVSSIIQAYSSFNIWTYFTALGALLFLLCLYFALRTAEKMFATYGLSDFNKGERSDMILIRNIGMVAFAAAFIAKAVFHLV